MLQTLIEKMGGRDSLMFQISNVVTTLTIIILCISALVIYMYYTERQEALKIYNVPKDIKVRSNYLTDVVFKNLTKNLKILERDKGRPEGWAQRMAIIIVFGTVGFGIFLFMNKQIFIGIVLPVILLIVLTKITGMISVSVSEKIQLSLPYAIDSVIRALSKSDDLKTVLYDASQVLEDPLKGMLSQMSLKMMQNSPSIVLKDFMEEQKNIWVYAFCFTLLNYLEEASKEDTVTQLRQLKDVLDKENKDKNQNKAEKKMTIAINYTLCVLAVLALLGNLAMNPVGKTFFFSSALGMVCFLVGITLVVVSIFSNLLISSGKV